MGHIKPTLGRHWPTGCNQFVGGRPTLGNVVKPSRKADGPLGHAAHDLFADVLQLIVVHRAVAKATDQCTHVGIGQVRDTVLHIRAIQQRCVVAQALPAPVIFERETIERAQVVDPLIRRMLVHRRIRDAVSHDHFGGKALAGFGKVVGNFEQPTIGVVVYVYKARGNNPPCCIQDLLSVCGRQVTDLDNAIALNADVGTVARLLCAVNDGAVADNQIEHLYLRC